MERFIDLRKLSLDELAGVVNLYPWFGSARKELCRRMAGLGAEGWGEEQFSDAAMYIPSRRIISDMAHSALKESCTDKDVSDVIKRYISATGEDGPSSGADQAVKRQVRVVGGDYFSQREYDAVRSEGDMMFPKFSPVGEPESVTEERIDADGVDFYTETLAQIYAEQGYCEHAIHIYEKLILAYPEKNAYFAALIEKLRSED